MSSARIWIANTFLIGGLWSRYWKQTVSYFSWTTLSHSTRLTVGSQVEKTTSVLHDAVEELISCLAAKMTLAVHFSQATDRLMLRPAAQCVEAVQDLLFVRHLSSKTMLEINDPDDSHHSKVSVDDVSNLCVDVCGSVLLCAMFEWRRRYWTTNEGAEPHVNVRAASRNGNRSLMTSGVCAGWCKATSFRCRRFIGGRRRSPNNCFTVAGVPQVWTQATNKNDFKSARGNRINNKQSSKRATAPSNSFCCVPLQAAVNRRPLNARHPRIFGTAHVHV